MPQLCVPVDMAICHQLASIAAIYQLLEKKSTIE